MSLKMRRQLVRCKSLPSLNTAGLSSDPADKTQLNGSAVFAESEAVDPELIKPLELGFQREIVLRVVQDATKKLSDVYYHTPNGQKLRSRPEVSEYLGRNPKLPLTADNFTFARKSIYHPPQEVVRQATRRWNNGTTPTQAPKTPSSASPRTPLLGSTGEEPAADAPALSCVNRDGGISVRRSTRKQCLCCTESLGSRKRRRRTHPSDTTPQAKRGKKPVGPGSQPTRARQLRARPPSNGRPTTFRGSARPPRRCRAQSLGRLPKVTTDLPEAAKPTGGKKPDGVREREKRAVARRSLPCNSLPVFNKLQMSEDSEDESSSSDDNGASLEPSPKRALVLLQDVLKDDKTLPEVDEASPAGQPSSGDSGSVAPIALRAHVAPWQNSVSWEIYELLKERKMNAGDAVPDGEEGKTVTPKPRSVKTTLPRPLRHKKAVCEDEEQCAADLLNGGPTIVEESAEALEVVLEDAETGASTVLQRSPTQRSPTRSPATTQHPHQRTPAPIAPKGSPAGAGSGAASVLCSISCPQARGQTPQLLCTRCLCHFHPVCMGLEDLHPHLTGGQFVCKPCSKVSYHRAGKGCSRKGGTQLPRVGRAASGANPSPVQGPSTALVVSTVASTTAVPSSAPHASFVTSVSGVLAGAASSPGTISMPVVQLFTTPAGHGSLLPPLRFVCVASEPQPARPSLLPPTLPVGAPSPGLPVQVNTQPLRMPTLIAAPRPPTPVTAVIRQPGVPTVRLQSAPSANATQYYAIHLNHRLSDIDMASLSALMQQAALKGPAELQRVCNGQGVVLQKAPAQRAPQLSVPAGPSSLPQLTAPPQLMSAAALQPAPANSSVLKKSKVSSKSSTASAACGPNSAASSPAGVSAQKPLSGNALPVTQPQALASGAGTNSQPAVSVCAEAALKVPEGEPKATDRTIVPGTCDRAVLPKQPGGTQAVPGSEPSSPANIIMTSEAEGVVQAAATTAPQETATTAGVPRPDEHLEATAEDGEDTTTLMATFCKIENVVSIAAADNDWPQASDASEGEGRLVIVEGEGAEGSSNHNHVDESSSETRKETTTTSVSAQVKKPSESPLLEPPVPPTPPSDSNHSAEATESSASEQGPNDAGASNMVSARGPRKAARVKRVKRRKPPLDASASPSPSFPIWIRTQRQVAFVRDRTSPVDPLALHRDVVPNSARAFANAGCVMMSLNSVFSWLPLPSLCSAAQVCKSWNIAANSPFLWKRIDFRQFRVKDWDTCVLKMRFRGPEELVLDGESLDHLLPHAEHLGTVERVSLEVNPRQLACVSRAFPALRSLRALVVRKGSAAAAAVAANQNGAGEEGEGGVAGGKPPQQQPLRQASLGCLTELLCIRGLERLELSGAHGLALLPLTMAPSSLAQRCQQLRSLSLTTVQQLSPVVVFPISLLEQLEELRLGNCTNWSTASFVNLCQLRELRRLTLEHGEDGPGFHTMLLKLSRLESLELKRWTLRDSLCDVLPRMKRLRSLLLWPHINSLASKTHRNTLRSCLSAGAGLERFTWIVGCKQLVKGGSSGMNKVLSLSVVQHVAPDLRLAFEPGTLCGCQAAADPDLASFASSSEAAETATCASPDTKSRKSSSNAGAGDASTSNATSSRASIRTSPRKSANAPVSNPEAPCCPLAQKISEVWKLSSEETWHMTLRQLRDGLQRLMVPRTAVCVCLHVES